MTSTYVPYIGASKDVNLGSYDLTANILNITGNASISHKLTVKSINVTNQIYSEGNLIITGNMSVKRPYGMFSDITNQVMAVASTAYVVNFSTTEDAYQIYITANRQNITVAQSGDYLIELSAIVDSDSPARHIELWVQKNGVNIPRSNTIVQLPSASTETVIAVPFIIDLLPTDNFRIMMATDDAGSRLLYTANTSYSPAAPSIIIIMSKISEIT